MKTRHLACSRFLPKLHKSTFHQVNLSEILVLAELQGFLLETVVISVEPLDISAWGTDLTAPVQQAIPKLMQCVLKDISSASGEWIAKDSKKITTPSLPG